MESNILTDVLEVFTQVGNWIGTSFTSLMPMFYSSDSGLTLLGVLACSGLAFAVVFLLINIIKGFLRFQ